MYLLPTTYEGNQTRGFGKLMAKFEVSEREGMRWVDIHLQHEMVRVESGALSYLIGDIAIHSKLVPSFGGMIRSLMADESVYRPTYTGTGIITLESSLGGFHVIRLRGESWILERGAYWASEGAIEVKFHRERTMTSLWAGEGLVYLQTKVTGYGQLVLTTRGPVEELTLQPGQEFVAEGNYVVCRTAEVGFHVRRPTKNYLGRFTSGEGFVRVYKGPGRLLITPTPYWRYYMMQMRTQNIDLPSRTTV
jgi:uncharacterized protein (AIM24 family)